MATTVDLRIDTAPRDALGSHAGPDDRAYVVHMSVDENQDATAALAPLGEMGQLAGLFGRDRTEADREVAGKVLFGALLGGALADHWSTVSQAADQACPTRVSLDIRPTELRSLPWELLRNDDRWLWRRRDLLWRRRSGGATVGTASGEPEGELGPLRVLAVVCNPRDHRLLAEKELARISGTLEGSPGRTHVEVLDGPSRTALVERIEQLRPHILHFIGHGMPRPDGVHALHFNWKPGEHDPLDWSLSTQQVADLTRWKPQLVVLNACRTAQTDTDDRIGGLAHAFLDAGTRAVVSMQGDIDSPEAVRFSGAFYDAIGEHRPVDEAVAAARDALGQCEGRPTDAWALPVLLTAVAPERVMTIRYEPPPPARPDAMDRSRPYYDLRHFVGRARERREAWWALDNPGLTPGGTERPLLVIGGFSQTGHVKTGKTWFTRWCLATYFLRGHRVLSVDLSGGTKDWLTVIQEIRRQATARDQLCPLSEKTFAAFDKTLVRLALGVPGAAPEADAAGTGPLRFNDEAGHSDERREAILDSLLAALRTAAAGRPMVIALDHADRIQHESFTYWLYGRLIRPIAYGEAQPLRLILVASNAWLGDTLPPDDTHMIGRVTLGDFESAQLMRLVRAYGHRRRFPVDEKVEEMVKMLQSMGKHTRVDILTQLTAMLPAWYGVDERGA
ncbi:CHAT domain-containing protein [Streptomyces sp. 8N706]|uniref:CHAT domain-containing protein n=1 Tax=Streptomyces sp. 8N706 TaxID=3457416 RepID=UPI003FD4FF19